MPNTERADAQVVLVVARVGRPLRSARRRPPGVSSPVSPIVTISRTAKTMPEAATNRWTRGETGSVCGAAEVLMVVLFGTTTHLPSVDQARRRLRHSCSFGSRHSSGIVRSIRRCASRSCSSSVATWLSNHGPWVEPPAQVGVAHAGRPGERAAERAARRATSRSARSRRSRSSSGLRNGEHTAW